MSTLQLHDTTESDIENVMSMEKANAQFVLPNSYQEHENLIASKRIAISF